MSRNMFNARAAVDAAVSRAYRSLGRNNLKRDMFARLLHVAREKSNLLRIPRGRGVRWEHALMFARGLRNLAERRDDFVRGPSGWSSDDSSPLRTFASLADYLLGQYETPRCLALSWLERRSNEWTRRTRDWHIAVSRGARFRDLNPPIAMTRRMEREFLRAPHDLSAVEALRYAQVLGMGGERDLAGAVLDTRLGMETQNDDFWRTVIGFFIREHEKGMSLEHVGPIVDCLQGLRFTRTSVETNRGREYRKPPRPDLEMKGRNLRSVLAMVEQWHEELAKTNPRNGKVWRPSRFRDFQFLEYRDVRDDRERGIRRVVITWKLQELLSSEELFREGRAMRHCVSLYDRDCAHGRASIWSLTREQEGVTRRRLTIEVDPRTARIRQVQGPRNTRPDPTGDAIVQRWMRREGLVKA